MLVRLENHILDYNYKNFLGPQKRAGQISKDHKLWKMVETMFFDGRERPGHI